MTTRRLVTVFGATGAQGGAIVRALLETKKYKICGLTRDPNSEKAQALQSLSNDIEVVKCDITNNDDVQHAFKDSWAVFALTDSWAQPHQPEGEVQQGTVMADTAASLDIPYYIFSMTEDIAKQLHGKFESKDKITFGYDVDNVGSIVREILENPEKFVSQVIRVCGEEISFEDIPKTFTKVTGIPAIAKTLTEEEFRESLNWLPKSALDALLDMYKWFEVYDLYKKDTDWTNGQKITKLNTFEEWLEKTGWKGE